MPARVPFVAARGELLRARREALISRSASLREQVLPKLDQLDELTARARQARWAWFWVREHRQTLGLAALGLLAGVAVVRPRRVWRLGVRAWSVWVWWKRWQAQRQGVSPQAPAARQELWRSLLLPALRAWLGRRGA